VGDDCGVPPNAAIELRFDRYLRPDTAVRQSLQVYSTDPENAVFLQPEYDVVERVVTYRAAPEDELEPGALYTVELPVADQHATGFGFRAFDGAALEEGPIPLKFLFRTSRVRSEAAPPAPPPTCAELLQLFRSERAGCARSGCHGAAAEFGCVDGGSSELCARDLGLELDLSSGQGIRRSAFDKPAHQTETAPFSGRPLVNPTRFGVAMPVVAPDSAATSYLMYKLLIGEKNFDACTTRHRVPLPDGECLFSAAEAARLREWFVLGAPMPLEGRISVADLQLLQQWINGGTSFESCE
jgi:hypothetical protein